MNHLGPWRSRAKGVLASLLAVLLVALAGLALPGAAAFADDADRVADDVFVRSGGDADTNFASKTSLIMGKGRHTYIRINLEGLALEDGATATVNFTYSKGNTGNTIVATEASDFASKGGAETADAWSSASVTYNTRPLDVADGWKVKVPADASLSLDVTELVKKSLAAGKSSVTVHLTTADVDNDTAAVEYRRKPVFAVKAAQVVEATSPFKATRVPTDRYIANSSVAQKVFHIKDADGSYVKVAKDGAFSAVANAEDASVFALYVFDPNMAGYTGDGAEWLRTTYAIKCLDNGKYLTTQNYPGDGTSKVDWTKNSYQNQKDGVFTLTATAPTVSWDERFEVNRFDDQTDAFEIKSHLSYSRDIRPDKSVASTFRTFPVRFDAKAGAMTVSESSTDQYKFTFEDAKGADPLEVMQDVDGATASLSWYPVNGDADPAAYAVSGSAGAVTFDGTLMHATVKGLATGKATKATVSHGSQKTTVSLRAFNHPGAFLSADDLAAMKEHIAKKEEPWYSDYQRLQTEVPNGLSSYDYQPHALEATGRGDYTPAGQAIANFEYDGDAAYFNALQWVITGDARYADAVVRILNAWSDLKAITGRDRILGAGIDAFRFINAAEIVKYYDGGYAGYSDADFARFQTMCENVIYPVIEDMGGSMYANGNWDIAAMVSVISLGSLLDSAPAYDAAVAAYQSPYVNGSILNYVADWGQTQESFRDQSHAQLGVGMMGDIATVAENQGTDLWSLYDNRLGKAFNWSAQYNLWSTEGLKMDASTLPDITKGRVVYTKIDQDLIARGELRPVYETGLAHYSKVEGFDASWMAKAAEAQCPQGYVHNDNLNFGTLTSYDGKASKTAAQPYFQMRTRMEKVYQRTWGEVNKYGTPADGQSDTVASYFGIDEDGQVRNTSLKANAPYWQLVTNEDGTYAVKNVAAGTYLSVSDETVKNAAGEDENIILGTAKTVGENEKFLVKGTGPGYHYLVSPSHGNRVVVQNVEGDLNSSTNATKLTLRLSQLNGDNVVDPSDPSKVLVPNQYRVILYYNTEDVATAEPERADTAALEASIEKAAAVKNDDYAYSDDSYKKLAAALADARQGVKDAKQGRIDQAKVDALAKALDAALSGLEKNTVPAGFVARVEAESLITSMTTGNVTVRGDGDVIPLDAPAAMSELSGVDLSKFSLSGASRGEYVDFSDPIKTFANGNAYGSEYASSRKGGTGDDKNEPATTVSGDTATWKVSVPMSGFYRLSFKYNNPATRVKGYRNDRDERNMRIVVNAATDASGKVDLTKFYTDSNQWAGWMIFNISGYNKNYDAASNTSLTPQTDDGYKNVIGNTAWNSNFMNVYLEKGDNTITLGIQYPPGQGVYDGANLDYFDVTYVGDQYVSKTDIPYVGKDFKFEHPGIYYTLDDLETMKARKNDADTVWGKGYAEMKASKGASLDYQPSPQELMNVGPYNSPNYGGTQYTNDGNAALYQALLWYLDKDDADAQVRADAKAHAKKAMEILNGWASTLKTVADGNDLKLRFSIVGPDYVNAAEILKHIYNSDPSVADADKWQADDMKAFDGFVRKLLAKTSEYYPQANGNWDALIGGFNMAAAVYLDDVQLFNDALTQRELGTIQGGNVASMGSLPNYVYATGESQETSRDATHSRMGISGLAYQSEIAWNQGIDLYGDYGNRLFKGAVYNATYLNGKDVASETFVSDKNRKNSDISSMVFEILSNHYTVEAANPGTAESMAEIVQARDEKLRAGGTKNEAKASAMWYGAMTFTSDQAKEATGVAISLAEGSAETLEKVGDKMVLKATVTGNTQVTGVRWKVPEDMADYVKATENEDGTLVLELVKQPAKDAGGAAYAAWTVSASAIKNAGVTGSFEVRAKAASEGGTDQPGTDKPGTDENGTDQNGGSDQGQDGGDGSQDDGAGKPSTSKKKGILPQTGDENGSLGIAAGSMAAMAGAAFAAARRLRRER